MHSAGYHWLTYMDEAGQWSSVKLEPQVGTFGEADGPNLRLFGDQHLDLLPPFASVGTDRTFGIGAEYEDATGDLVLLSKGTDPAVDQAVGLFVPQVSRFNREPVVGVEATTGRRLYGEDRRMQWRILSGTRGRQGSILNHNGAHYENFFTILAARLFFTGLLAPRHGDPNAIEQLKSEVYLLFGTPEQIRTTSHIINSIS